MASPEQKRKFNTYASVAFGIGSAVFMAMSAYYVFVPAPKRPAPIINASRVDPKACSDTLQFLGFTVDPSKTNSSKIVATAPLPSDITFEAAPFHMDKMSLAATICKYEINEFCMGTQCIPDPTSPQPGTLLVLNIPSDNKSTSRPKPPSSSASSASSAASSAKKPTPNKPTTPASTPKP